MPLFLKVSPLTTKNSPRYTGEKKIKSSIGSLLKGEKMKRDYLGTSGLEE